LNDGSAVVHDRVDSGNLLEHLQEAAEEEGPQDGRTLKDLDENVGRLASLTSVLLTGRGEDAQNNKTSIIESTKPFIIGCAAASAAPAAAPFN
jgi:hypothetical protein